MSREMMMSKCCGSVCIVESIWLNIKRTDGTTGRKAIAEVVLCGAATCHKIIGDVKSICSPKIAPQEWADLLGVKKNPPFYFNDVNGELVPDGLDLATFQQRKFIQPGRTFSLAPQERAANEQEPEWEPE